MGLIMAELRPVLFNRLSKVLGTKAMRMRNVRPIVCFTFDDIPHSAAKNGAGVLEAYEARGTFYVSGRLCDSEENGTTFASSDDIALLNGHGHELGCHTYSHTPVSQLTFEGMAAEVHRNAEFMKRVCGNIVLGSFAYPFGDVSPARKFQVRSIFASCRGIHRGINAGVVDLALLKAVALYDQTIDRNQIARYIDDVRRRNGLLIFYTHDVNENPSAYGVSIQLLEFCVQQAKLAACDVLTVKDAISAIGHATPYVR